MTLVTGFDAFGRLGYNPSERLVEALRPDLDQQQIRTLILPTSYEHGWRVLREAMMRPNVHSVVMFGYSGRARGLRFERYAHNHDTAKSADNDGVVRSGPIVLDAPDRLPVSSFTIVGRMARAGFNMAVSDNAGGFVCNHVLFRALHEVEGSRRPIILFAHVPDWERLPGRNAIKDAARMLIDLVTARP